MKYVPILFNTEMVRAILEGRKTQTRRLVKQPPILGDILHDEKGWYYEDGTRNGHSLIPPCHPGDVLWVRETWCDPYPENPLVPFAYKADFLMHWDADQTEHGDPIIIAAEEMKWKPSIHMPKEAARIFLRVKDVRVERLNDMDEEAAIAEGFPDFPAGADSPIERFSSLWDKTVKRDDLREYGYHANPWVWVIEFERCDTQGGQYLSDVLPK